MDNNGWIRLHRSIAYHWIWNSSKHFQRWVDMLFMASWEKKTIIFNRKTVVLKRGQFVTSSRELQRRWGTNAKGVHMFLSTLVSDGMINCITNNIMTLITIVNYDKYQSVFSVEKERKVTGKSKRNLSTETTSQITDTGQREKQHHINNNKNINNNSLSLSRESSEKIFEEVKGNDKFWEDCCRSLSLEKAEVESLLNAFFSAKVDTDEFPDSYSKFKNYFLNWARNQINSNSNGTKQKPGATAEDKYANRRGVEPSAVKEKNFKSGF